MVNWLERAQTVFRESPAPPTAVTDVRSTKPVPDEHAASEEHLDELDRWAIELRFDPPRVRSSLVCFACHECRFWYSIHGTTICAKCHPPGSPKLVARWIDGDEGQS